MLTSIGLPAKELCEVVQGEATIWRPDVLVSRGLDMLIEKFERPKILVRNIANPDTPLPVEQVCLTCQIGEYLLFSWKSQPDWGGFDWIPVDLDHCSDLGLAGTVAYLEFDR